MKTKVVVVLICIIGSAISCSGGIKKETPLESTKGESITGYRSAPLAPDGTVMDTPEVALAKAQHLVAHHLLASHASVPKTDSSVVVERVDDHTMSLARAKAAYFAELAKAGLPIPEDVDHHNVARIKVTHEGGDIEDSDDVALAKSLHFAAHAKALGVAPTEVIHTGHKDDIVITPTVTHEIHTIVPEERHHHDVARIELTHDGEYIKDSDDVALAKSLHFAAHAKALGIAPTEVIHTGEIVMTPAVSQEIHTIVPEVHDAKIEVSSDGYLRDSEDVARAKALHFAAHDKVATHVVASVPEIHREEIIVTKAVSSAPIISEHKEEVVVTPVHTETVVTVPHETVVAHTELKNWEDSKIEITEDGYVKDSEDVARAKALHFAARAKVIGSMPTTVVSTEHREERLIVTPEAKSIITVPEVSSVHTVEKVVITPEAKSIITAPEVSSVHTVEKLVVTPEAKSIITVPEVSSVHKIVSTPVHTETVVTLPAEKIVTHTHVSEVDCDDAKIEVTANGYLKDSEDVARAKALHFAAHAKAIGVIPSAVVHTDEHLIVTPEAKSIITVPDVSVHTVEKVVIPETKAIIKVPEVSSVHTVETVVTTPVHTETVVSVPEKVVHVPEVDCEDAKIEIGADGYVKDSEDVARAKALHFAAHAKAFATIPTKVLTGELTKETIVVAPVHTETVVKVPEEKIVTHVVHEPEVHCDDSKIEVSADGYLKDSEDVAHAKALHFAAHAKAIVPARIVEHEVVHHVDDAEAKAFHFAAHEKAIAALTPVVSEHKEVVVHAVEDCHDHHHDDAEAKAIHFEAYAKAIDAIPSRDVAVVHDHTNVLVTPEIYKGTEDMHEAKEIHFAAHAKAIAALTPAVSEHKEVIVHEHKVEDCHDDAEAKALHFAAYAKAIDAIPAREVHEVVKVAPEVHVWDSHDIAEAKALHFAAHAKAIDAIPTHTVGRVEVSHHGAHENCDEEAEIKKAHFAAHAKAIVGVRTEPNKKKYNVHVRTTLPHHEDIEDEIHAKAVDFANVELTADGKYLKDSEDVARAKALHLAAHTRAAGIHRFEMPHEELTKFEEAKIELTPDGKYIKDSDDVAYAKSLHFAAHEKAARAKAIHVETEEPIRKYETHEKVFDIITPRNYDAKIELTSDGKYVIDAKDLVHAKSLHFVTHEETHPIHEEITHKKTFFNVHDRSAHHEDWMKHHDDVELTHDGKYVKDAPDVAHEKALHFDAHDKAIAGLHHAAHPDHVEVTEDGYIKDSDDVAYAKSLHFAAQEKAIANLHH